MSRSAWPESVNHRHDGSGSRFRATTRPTREGRWKCADGGGLDEAERIRRFIWSLLGRCRKAECKEHSADGFLVVMAEGPYPIPSRTRKSSPPAPMVLQGPPCGRVGRRQIYAPDTQVSGASFLVRLVISISLGESARQLRGQPGSPRARTPARCRLRGYHRERRAGSHTLGPCRPPSRRGRRCAERRAWSSR